MGLRDNWRRGSRGNALARPLRWLANHALLTGRGWLLALLCGLCLWRVGLRDLDLVVLAMSVTGFVLLLCCVASVAGAAVYLRRNMPRSATTGMPLDPAAPITTGFQLPAIRRAPWMQVSWVWAKPPGVQVRIRQAGPALVEEAVAMRRGLVPSVVRRFCVADVFGLARITWLGEEPTAVTILPDARHLRSMAVLRSLGSGDGSPNLSGKPEGDRVEIRRYASGDTVRDILWKSFARTRQLSVRLPERTVSQSARMLAYLVAADDDEAAAAAARAAVEHQSLGADWTFGADGSMEATGDSHEALRMIARSGSIGAEDGSAHPQGFEIFVNRERRGTDFRCVVFVPGRAGDWQTRCLELSRRHRGAFSFVVATDGVRRPEKRPLWRTLLFRSAPPSGTAIEDLRGVVRSLAASGAAVVVVDREQGRTYDGLRFAASGVPE